MTRSKIQVHVSSGKSCSMPAWCMCGVVPCVSRKGVVCDPDMFPVFDKLTIWQYDNLTNFSDQVDFYLNTKNIFDKTQPQHTPNTTSTQRRMGWARLWNLLARALVSLNVLLENLSGHCFHRSTSFFFLSSEVITFLPEGKVLRF